MQQPLDIVFFDLHDTLAAVLYRVHPADDPLVHPYEEVLEVLRELVNDGVHVGILAQERSRTRKALRREVLKSALGPLLDERLVMLEPRRALATFETAAAWALAHPERGGREVRLLYVGPDAATRITALHAGFRVAPHPALARAALGGRVPLLYVRIGLGTWESDVPWRDGFGDCPVVPLHVSGAGEDSCLYAIADEGSAAVLCDRGFVLDRLGRDDAPLTTDLHLVLFPENSARGTPGAMRTRDSGSAHVLAATEEGLYVAIPGGRSVVSIMSTAEGKEAQAMKLQGARTLLDAAPASEPVPIGPPPPMAPAVTAHIREGVKPEDLRRIVDHLAGNVPVKGVRRIVSRDLRHPHNELASRYIQRELRGIPGMGVDLVGMEYYGIRRHNVIGTLPGTTPGIVVVGAHLDSIAPHGSNPYTAAAPGADDNASGVAAVLQAARVLASLSATAGGAHRTILFAFFNGEESSLAGSMSYALALRNRKVPIRAMFQLDMVGWDKLSPTDLEVHVGSPRVHAPSEALANLVQHAAVGVPTRAMGVQRYPHAPDHLDPAHPYSDHSSFHHAGFAACLICEDRYPGAGSKLPQPDTTPHYHRASDTEFHANYAAEVARVAAAAAWMAAT